MSTKSTFSSQPPTRAEQETASEAERLTREIRHAREAVTAPTHSDSQELVACADRVERAARDLAVALRELARERQNRDNER
ncbi:MAG: hypothetical protein H0V88_13220 [Pyrinomonadaceae bacterium]|nr:hypothetical protein [Pyrinomonadaceae bacterium]